MPMRPIDAIFVHPERRLYVVYYRGQLWQLPRMKLDVAAWQRRVPYNGDSNALYLSHNQAISDKDLAQQLRTLNLPTALHGSSLATFEAWWQVQGFGWLQELIDQGKSPLAAHQGQVNLVDSNLPSAVGSSANTQSIAADSSLENDSQSLEKASASKPIGAEDDMFASMLAELADEMRDHHGSTDK